MLRRKPGANDRCVPLRTGLSALQFSLQQDTYQTVLIIFYPNESPTRTFPPLSPHPG